MTRAKVEIGAYARGEYDAFLVRIHKLNPEDIEALADEELEPWMAGWNRVSRMDDDVLDRTVFCDNCKKSGACPTKCTLPEGWRIRVVDGKPVGVICSIPCLRDMADAAGMLYFAAAGNLN